MSVGKILFLMADGFDTPTSINQLIETLLCDVLDDGIDVHMVAGRKGGLLPDIPKSLSSKQGFTYSIVDRGATDKRNFFKRYFYELHYVIKAMKAWKGAEGVFDCVVLQSNPLGLFHALALKRVLRIPIIYNMYDIFPDNTRDVVGEIPFKVFSYLQKRLYRLCDEIIVVSDDMKRTLADKGVPESKVSVIPNWYDEQSVGEVEKKDNRFICKYGIDTSKFIVQFAGSMGYVFDYESILRIAEILKANDNIEFHMIGQGTRLDDFKNAAGRLGLSSIRFFPWQPIEEIADVYSACSIGIVPLAKNVIFNAYPSKTSLLMACGRTVVYSTESNSRFSRMINEEEIGYALSSDDHEAIAETIDFLFKHPEEIHMRSENARAFARRHLSRSVNTKKFIQHIKEIGRNS